MSRAEAVRPPLAGLSVAAVLFVGAACGGSSSAAGDGPAPRPSAEDLGSGEPVTIAFGGDTAIEGPSIARLKEDPTSVFGPITVQLGEADLAFLNLETAITTGPATPEDKQFTFSTGPRVFDALRSAGVDAVTMANNHAIDFGSDGLAQTLDAIEDDGFPVVGIGRDEAAALAPRLFEVKGQRIALLGTTEVIDSSLVDRWSAVGDRPGVSSAKRVDALVDAVKAAREQADTVVVFIHWGEQYVP
ncbi:MAG: CapA family protein [Candidatus Microthrix sp.]|nr:CapA family protein [Candidatus Microthrix sp.]